MTTACACACCADETAVYAVLRPSKHTCDSVILACGDCNAERTWRGFPVPLVDVADEIARLGDDPRTRRAGYLLALAVLNSARASRARRYARRPPKQGMAVR